MRMNFPTSRATARLLVTLAGLGAAASVLALTLPLFLGCSSGGYSGGRSDASVSDAQGPSQDALMPDLLTANSDGAVDLRRRGMVPCRSRRTCGS